jgi:CheY-like chemotaxis protein
LALVRGITEEHGGRVWAESPGPGKGSQFILEVPLIAKPAGATVRDAAAASLPIQVLLVEDNRDTRELLVKSLELMRYEVQPAAAAEEALEYLRQNRPDLILSDIALPGIDGYEFLRRARQIPGLATVPAFAVTGYGQEQDVVRAYQSGYTGHFVKPVDLGALDKRIRELFSSVSHEKQTGSQD